jgi:hypothetical protein
MHAVQQRLVGLPTAHEHPLLTTPQVVQYCLLGCDKLTPRQHSHTPTQGTQSLHSRYVWPLHTITSLQLHAHLVQRCQHAYMPSLLVLQAHFLAHATTPAGEHVLITTCSAATAQRTCHSQYIPAAPGYPYLSTPPPCTCQSGCASCRAAPAAPCTNSQAGTRTEAWAKQSPALHTLTQTHACARSVCPSAATSQLLFYASMSS